MKTRRGIGAIEIVIIATVLIVIAGLVWYAVFRGKSVINDNPSNNEAVTAAEKNSANDSNKDTTAVSNLESQDSATPVPSQASNTTTQYVNGVSFQTDSSVGIILSWALTSENSNLSSSTLLAKEKEIYGDSDLACTANAYPLGRISVRESSTTFPGFVKLKKLSSGKYLSYQDDGTTSACYSSRPALRDLQTRQIELLKSSLQNAQ